MMSRFRTLCTLLSFSPAAIAAQSGAVTYTKAVKHSPELSAAVAKMGMRASNLPTASTSQFMLRFNESSSEFAAVKVEEKPIVMGDHGGDVMIVKMTSSFGGFGGGGGQEELLAAYTDLGAGTLTQALSFLGKGFLVSEERPRIRWKLTTEQSKFLDQVVVKATATLKDQAVEAWFAPQIPVSAGPAEFGGLPGLILALTIGDGEIAYSATKLELAPLTAQLVAPTKGDKVSREQYDKIVAEKLLELKGSSGGKGTFIIKHDGGE